MDLSGKWKFKEDFSYGIDEGFAEFKQEGNEFTGILEFTETIEEDVPFKVKCFVSGFVVGNSVTINVDDFKILESDEEIDYYPESREGIINANGQIVGSSEDSQGVCGVFVFDRI